VAKGVRREVVGSGMVRRVRDTVDLNESPSDIATAALEELVDSWRWDRSLLPLIPWLETQLPQLSACPGRDDERCCGRWRADRQDWGPCVGGQWRELEDLQWYIRDVHQRIGYLRDQVARGDAIGAAIFGIELGAAVLQLLLKLGLEADWLKGKDIRAKLARGSEINRRQSASDRRAAVNAYIAQGHTARRAFDFVARDSGVKWQTIRGDYYPAKKKKPVLDG